MSKDVISYDTNIDLWTATERYADTVEWPHRLPLGQFASAYSGLVIANPQTLIIAREHRLAVSAKGDNIDRLFLNVDLFHDQPSAIVSPGFYDLDGDPSTQFDTFARPSVRPLTENEGRTLIADLDAIATSLPRDQH